MSETPNSNDGRNVPPQWAMVVSVVSGIVFLIALLVIAVFIPNPTPFSLFVFRVVLSLAAAGFAAAISGFLTIKLPLLGRGVIAGGGALAVFVIVYQVNPPELIAAQQPQPTDQRGLVNVTQATTIGALAVSRAWQEGSPRVSLTSTAPELQNFLFAADSGFKQDVMKRWCAASSCLVCEPSDIQAGTPEVRVSLRPNAKVKRTPLGGGYPKNVKGSDGKPLNTYQVYEIVDENGQRYAYVCQPASAKRNEFDAAVRKMQATKTSLMGALEEFQRARSVNAWRQALEAMQDLVSPVKDALKAAIDYNASLPDNAKDKDFKALEGLLHRRLTLLTDYLPNGTFKEPTQADLPSEEKTKNLIEAHQKILSEIDAAQQRVNKETE